MRETTRRKHNAAIGNELANTRSLHVLQSPRRDNSGNGRSWSGRIGGETGYALIGAPPVA